jgi:hypothetical protein
MLHTLLHTYLLGEMSMISMYWMFSFTARLLIFSSCAVMLISWDEQKHKPPEHAGGSAVVKPVNMLKCMELAAITTSVNPLSSLPVVC